MSKFIALFGPSQAMKPNPKVLDEVDLQVSSQEPTQEERKEMSAFIRHLKQKSKEKPHRVNPPVTRPLNV